MSHGLVRDILRFHLAPEADPGLQPAPGVELPLRVDHVLAGGRAGLLALAAFARIARGAPQVDLAMASADRGAGPAAFETPEELQALHAAAHRAGARFSRPGHGRGDIVHLERFAVPGRILLAAGRRDAPAGAVGMLALSADPVEVGAVLGGGAFYLAWPGLRFLDCQGALLPGVDGYDVMLDLAARLGPCGAGGTFLEATGAGVAALGMAGRVALAGAAGALGARAVLFPSDEITRAALRAQGREPEWKALPPTVLEADDDVIPVVLDAIVPRCAPLDALADGRPLGESGPFTVDAVEIGPGATLDDLERLARALDGRRLRAGLHLVVVPGSRQLMEVARDRGVLDRLVNAGGRVLEPGLSASHAAPGGARRTGVCAGVLPDPADPRDGWWSAGIDTCAAACVTGTLCDPRGLDLPRGPIELPEIRPSTENWILRPDAGPADASVDEGAPPFPLAAPIEGPLRGSVLIVAGDGVAAEQILPWGARIRPLLADTERLGGFVFHGIDDAFPERARRHGGGWIVAGARFGHGRSRDPVALAPLALGVRGVMAVSFAADYRRQLVNAGILPLRFVVPAEHGRIQTGDELELPGVPDELWEGAPLVVRNLTRGTRFTVRHELNARQLETLVAGGLLRRAAAAARA